MCNCGGQKRVQHHNQDYSQRHASLGLVVFLLAASTQWSIAAVAGEQHDTATVRPNIVFIVFEDMSQRIGAFGDEVATTPTLDALAASGVRYTNVFTTSGVCAPSRSSLITGVHQQVMGTQHMRTNGKSSFKGGGPIEYEAVPPAEIKAFPELLRRAGYFTTNNGKTDYQFGTPFTYGTRPARMGIGGFAPSPIPLSSRCSVY